MNLNNENTGVDTIDFQEFIDIILTKIEEKLSKDDIRYGFMKISNITRKENESNDKYLFSLIN